MKLELDKITKKFGDFTANDSIDLVVDSGEVHCLLGENGAGKSTLMNVLYGLYQPTSGRILLDDKETHFDGPGDAMRAGIGMVHQHFMLIPVFTVAENVALGSEKTGKADLLDLEYTKKKIRDISTKYNLEVDPDAKVEDLSVGAQQRVEIIKALMHDAEILILDEPTAVLTPQEIDELLDIIRQLKSNGTSIVMITHKLREVKAIADKITVIRRGQVVGDADPNASETDLASLMVGHAVNLEVDKEPANPKNHTFQVKDLVVTEDNGVHSVDGITFDVAEGEIMVIAGVQGNGQTELTEAILGLKKNVDGSIKLNEHEFVGKTVKQILDYGLGFVPEDRSVQGMVGDFSIKENLILDLYDKPPYSNGVSLDTKFLEDNAEKKVEEFDIRTESIEKEAGQLSGGNQQKVILARELARDLKLFIASQPTRGLDVGSIEFVHKRIVHERDKGIPVIIVSSELDEVEQLADRIAVLCKGKIVGIVPPDTSRDVLGLMMAGMTAEEAEKRAKAMGSES
ncbi:MAG: ABC transporter ATP-binding protein [Micrococcaceae bacterium]